MNSSGGIRKRITKIVKENLEVCITDKELEDGATLDQLFGFDSVVAIEFILGLEREFGIQIEPERLELETLTDMTRLTEYIEQRLNQ